MSLERLHRLEAEHTARQFEMSFERGRFAALASRHEDGTAPRAVSAFNLFQTPPELARRMTEIAAELVPEPKTILEPSAGLGRLFSPAWDRWGGKAHFCLVEESRECMAELYRLTEHTNGVRLRSGDYLQMDDLGLFDLVMMNPPFKQGRDIKHIRKALCSMRETGALVALCYNGTKQNAILKPMARTWEVLPAGTFKDEGTRADVVLLTIKGE